MTNPSYKLCIVLSLLWGAGSFASKPLWSIEPLANPAVSVPANQVTSILYSVRNESYATHNLALTAIPGITSSGCDPFMLATQQSCILTLTIDGSQVASGNTGGPEICEKNSLLQCYRPSKDDTLNITVTANTYSVSGTINNLINPVTLNVNGNSQVYGSNGNNNFITGLTSGQSYSITVATNPSGQTCSVTNGSGTIGAANVSDVIVDCVTNNYTVSGSITGLTGTISLLNNGSDTVTNTYPASNFIFPQTVPNNSTYNVTIGSQPTGQTCYVANGSGTMGTSPVTNVSVNCYTNTTLSLSPSNIALAASGAARTLTVTNTGTASTFDLNVTTTYPPPAGTQIESHCPATLAPAETCTVTITPGSTTSSDCATAYNSPAPTILSVDAYNVPSAQNSNMVVLNYGCIYQQGYLFAIDDSTANTTSIGGTIVALSGTQPFVPWNSNSSYYPSISGAASLTDGASNTQAIVEAFGAPTTASGNYAAYNCSGYSIDSSGNSPCVSGTCYSSWYLPAICQMIDSSSNPTCQAGTANFITNLPQLVTNCTQGTACFITSDGGYYWSSTQVDPSNAYTLFNLYTATASGTPFALNYRCVRNLTN